MMRSLAVLLLLLILAPLTSHAIWWLMQEHPRSWSEANWTSAQLLPAARANPEAVVHVLAGRTGRWKGIFAHHTWIVVKPRGGDYSRYDVVGWGRPVRRNGWDPDGRWYGDTPRILLTLRGADAERAIPRILSAIESYPFAAHGSYVAWPGPNSNTFVAYVARQVPELAQALLPTAVGKDFAGWPIYVGRTPSHTGIQVSLGGLIGVSVGWIEGIELNVFGLIAGLDLRRPALKLPGWGRIGWPAAA